MGTDVIGDIHGHADALERLLLDLGYERRSGAYRHREHAALFLGDIVDRGPRQTDALRIVREMRDAGAAQVLMGNHELNAICYATRDPATGAHYRRRDTKNTAQHAAFLDEVGVDTAAHRESVAFFRELPLWIDAGGLRGVHACWSPAAMDTLAPHLDTNRRFTESGFHACQARGTPGQAAVGTLLKGPDMALPPGVSFVDSGGHRRRRLRLRWWDEEAKSARTAAVPEDGFAPDIPDVALPGHLLFPYMGPKPVFFGHYWMKGEPVVLDPLKACLDFSIAKDGYLCSYRYEGEPRLDPAKLTWVGRSPSPSPFP